jgi:predicted outer membrane repeat protein
MEGVMRASASLFWLVGLLGLAAAPAMAVTLRVGVGTGCDQPTLQAAFNVIRTQAGSHTIRINKGNYAVPDGMAYSPTVAQSAVFLEGGYASCTAPSPSGDPTTDADRAVFDGSGGLPRSVLDLRLFGQLGTFQIRRIVLTGGDAFVGASPDLNAGGGLSVRGPASVLIGLGTTIRNNGAGYGGGVALIGGPVHSGSVVDKVDFFIDEGASISGNSAAENGGGIYCGGANLPSETIDDRHGSIVFLDGTILGNSSKFGAALWCLGSVEGGGGLQPRPRADRAAWILANSETPGFFGCAAGFATLDRSLPADADGYRVVGADSNSNGLLAITNHSGKLPALCLQGSFSLGTNTVPAGQSRFRLNNLYLSDQGGSDVIGLLLDKQLELEVRPSGNAVVCSFFTPTSCVTLRNNQYDSGTPPTSATSDPLLRATNGAQLRLIRAQLAGNRSRLSMLDAFLSASVRLDASIISANQVDVNTLASAQGTQFARSLTTAKVRLNQSTVLFETPLDRFFRIEGTGSAVVLASALASTAAVAPANFGGGAAAANFTRERCGYFRRTDDLAGTTVVNDPGLGAFGLASGPSPELDPVSFSPTSALLIDRCTASAAPDRDYYGNAFGLQYYAGSSVFADIGAVEAQLPNDIIFANGFD